MRRRTSAARSSRQRAQVQFSEWTTAGGVVLFMMTTVIVLTAVVKLVGARFVVTLGSMEKIGAAVVVGMMLVACSSESDDAAPAVTCSIGELRGTWRVSYVETDGNCGQIPDEMAVFSENSQGAPSSCQVDVFDVAADKCRVDMNFTCPLNGVSGSQQWAGVLKQTADDKIEGTMTAQVDGATADCRSTYAVTWTRQ